MMPLKYRRQKILSVAKWSIYLPTHMKLDFLAVDKFFDRKKIFFPVEI